MVNLKGGFGGIVIFLDGRRMRKNMTFLSHAEKVLTQAIDYHLTDDNCNGVMIYATKDLTNQHYGYCDYIYECQKCFQLVIVRIMRQIE